jgi:hypothetical protein
MKVFWISNDINNLEDVEDAPGSTISGQGIARYGLFRCFWPNGLDIVVLAPWSLTYIGVKKKLDKVSVA